MVKRKRITSQNNQDDKNDEGANRATATDNSGREDAKATDNRIVGGGGHSAGEPPGNPSSSAVMFGTRSRSHLAAGPSNILPVESDGKTAIPAVTPRSSARVSNKRTLTKETRVITRNSAQQANKKKVSKQMPTKPGQLRTRRSWELWSVDDKNSFFEALCEYGKDFESISNHIAQKSKKRGVPPNMIKNKNQVRFFYYRTWHKIMKFLNVQDVKKQTLELYGLINYAELRKKKGACLNGKNQQKLKELVLHGVTTLKCRGKTFRIRTPVCRALKKLNNIEDTKDPEIQLPKDVLIEFRPKTNAAWMRIQSMAQNPRVRTRVSLHKRLSTLLAFLEKRWKPYRLRQKEKLLASLPELSNLESSKEKIPNLRVYLQNEKMFCALSVASMDVTSSADVCLDNYIKGLGMSERLKDTAEKNRKVSRSRIRPLNAIHNRICSKNAEDKIENNEFGNAGSTVENKKPLDDSDATIRKESNVTVTDPETEAKRSLSLLKNMIQSFDGLKEKCASNEEDVEEDIAIGPDVEKESELGLNAEPQRKTASKDNKKDAKTTENSCPVAVDLFLANQSENNNLTFGQFLSLRSEAETLNKDVEQSDGNKVNDQEDEAAKTGGQEEDHIIKKKEQELMTKIRNGWTREECGTLSIGELYLMLNHPDKIILEYDFEIQGDPQVKVLPESGPEAVRIPQKMRAHQLEDVLGQLVNIASFYFTDFKSKPQTPLSPTSRSQCRSGATIPSKTGGSGRGGGSRNHGPRTNTNNAKNNKSASTITPTEVITTDGKLASVIVANNNVGSSQEDPKPYTFAMPVRAAPRNLKNSSQDSDMMASIQKRSRGRGRSIASQRSSLPKSSDNSGTTVIHLLPCDAGGPNSPLIATNGLSKSPLQVNPVSFTDQGLSFTPGILSSTLVSSSSSTNPLAIPTTTTRTTRDVVTNSQSVIKTTGLPKDTLGQTNSISINPLSLNVISPDGNVQETISNLRFTAGSEGSPPQISIPENPNITMDVSPPPAPTEQASSICSLLNIPPQNESEHLLLDFNSNASISPFGISSKNESSSNDHLIIKNDSNDPLVSDQIQATPPSSPSSHQFKFNSPGGPGNNWINGEMSDFSLGSLLSFESPVKMVVTPPSGPGPSLGTSLETISRLGPDVSVDTHLQCLINESSVDYVAKFADLAAQVASTAMTTSTTENKCT